MDCPIAKYQNSTDVDLVVATHNPASVPINVVEIKVPHPNWKVRSYDDGEWVEAVADVICHTQQ